MASWTDSPATTSTHIRTIHINELRRTILRNRYKARLGGANWTDGPLVNSRTHIRAIHFTELHDAMVPYLGQLGWSVGSSPSASRTISQRDINDVRTWADRFSTGLGLPTGPDPADEGISSFSFDPSISPNAIINSSWVSDVAGLTPTTSPLWIRANILSDANDLIGQYYSAYQTALGYYQSASMPVQMLFTGELARTDYPNRNENASNSFFSNPYIDYFSAELASFAAAMSSYGARSCIIWNEPNDLSGATLDARVFGSLLYHCYQQVSSLQNVPGIIMGGLLWQDTIDHGQATQNVVNYLTSVYGWLNANGLAIPWDAVNVHVHNCGDPRGQPYGFSQQDMTTLRNAIDGVFALNDRRPVFVGEWGPNHNGAVNASCMTNAYNYLRETFDAMWYFQHPAQTSGCCGPSGCPSDYGTTAWGFTSGSPYQVYSTAGKPRCSEWGQLSTLLEQRNG